MTKTPAKRGRPRSFDADKALTQVRDVFWDAGFAATSLDDLSAATGLNRPSLYGAFGDKRELYLQVLSAYRERARAGLAAALSPERSLRDGIANVYERAMALYLPRERRQRGCLMISTAVTEAVLSDEVRESVSEGLRDIDRAFENRFRIAKGRGEIVEAADPHQLAMMASAGLALLSIKSRLGEPRRVLEAVARSTVDAICAISRTPLSKVRARVRSKKSARS